VVVAVWLWTSGIVAVAQEFRATLTGSVLDAAGLVLPGGTITATNLDTNASFPATTGSDGGFTLPLLPPGHYRVAASLRGFKTATVDRVELAVGQTAAIRLVLQVGDITEAVTVEATPAESIKSDRGSVVDHRQVTELPLNGRNPFMLSTLAAGVTYTGQAVFQRPFDNGAIADWSINGGVIRNNDFLLDGAPNNSIHGGNNIAYVPPVDAVQEFKVITNAYDAQYGRTGGGVVNVSLKSGTNRSHGTVYEFARRAAWDAQTFLENAHDREPSGHFLDQYGVEADGPLTLGRLYDGRDRTFFMLSVEGYREGTPTPTVFTYPDAAQRRGDFSNLRDASGNLITIYDPATGRMVNGQWIRDPFPGNVIPQDRIDPIARRLLGYFPAPNTQPTSGDPWRNNVVFAPNVARDRFRNLAVKIDHTFGDANHAFLRYADNTRTEERNRNGITSGPAQDGQLPLQRINHAGVVDWVRPLSRAMLIDLRGSTNFYVQDARTEAADGFDLTELGFPASLAGQVPHKIFPRIDFADYTYLGRGSTQRLPTTVIAAQPNVAWSAGPHALRSGADVRLTWYSPDESGFASMRLLFDRTFTQRSFTESDPLSGNAIASLLLGAASSGVVDRNVDPHYRWRYYAPWLQDDWRVSNRLTLNLGVRWDLSLPVTERETRLNFGFDRAAGGLLFAGQHGLPDAAYRFDTNNLQPRIGAAYMLDAKTVLRAGYGRFYLNPVGVGTSDGFSIQTPLVTSLDGNRTPAGTLADAFGSGIAAAPGASLGTATLLGGSPSFANPDFAVPHVTQFSAGVLRELPWAISVEAAYVGSRTADVSTTWTGFNEPDVAFRSQCDVTLGGNPAFCTERVTNPFFGQPGFAGTAYFTSPTLSRYDLARPYPQFAAFSEMDRNDGRLWYDALQVTARKRLSHDVTFTTAYTRSRTREQSAFLDDIARTMDLGPASSDRPHRLTASFVYTSPASGRRWLTWLRDWTVGGAGIYQSGRPWDMPAGVTYLGGAAVDAGSGRYIQGVRPCAAQLSVSGAAVLLPYSIAYGCDRPNFLIRPPFSGRTTPTRNGDIRQPSFRTIDLTVARTVPVARTLRLQLRAEVFNVLNEPMYDERPYTTDPFSSNFGTIDRASTAQSNFPRQIQLAAKLSW
jgi:hypothetical protein